MIIYAVPAGSGIILDTASRCLSVPEESQGPSCLKTVTALADAECSCYNDMTGCIRKVQTQHDDVYSSQFYDGTNECRSKYAQCVALAVNNNCATCNFDALTGKEHPLCRLLGFRASPPS